MKIRKLTQFAAFGHRFVSEENGCMIFCCESSGLLPPHRTKLRKGKKLRFADERHLESFKPSARQRRYFE